MRVGDRVEWEVFDGSVGYGVVTKLAPASEALHDHLTVRTDAGNTLTVAAANLSASSLTASGGIQPRDGDLAQDMLPDLGS